MKRVRTEYQANLALQFSTDDQSEFMRLESIRLKRLAAIEKARKEKKNQHKGFKF
jgi:hypothetical protein